MSTYCFHVTFKRLAGFLAIVLVSCVALSFESLRAETTRSSSDHPVIFLDPGHGGQDIGARGATGLQEKDVTLTLAKLVEEKLDSNDVVRLSRNDDYGLALYQRTENANSRNADLFISLHTGGAFNYSGEGIVVFYFLDSPGRILPEDSSEDEPVDRNTGRIPWQSVQYRHTSESRLLAQLLQAALADKAGTQGCHVIGAPLSVLSGADMPAVLIETGNLNNPAEEEKLRDPDYLASLAKAITGAIDGYFKKTADITSIDLHE